MYSNIIINKYLPYYLLTTNMTKMQKNYQRVSELKNINNFDIINKINKINEIIDDIGLSNRHNPDSIVRQDAYYALFINSAEENKEIWGCHYSNPDHNHKIYRLK